MQFIAFLLIILFFCIVFIAIYKESDEYVIKHGVQVNGRINKLDFRSRTDSYGKTYLILHISYSFRDQSGAEQTGAQYLRISSHTKSSYCRFKEDDVVTVFYLEDNPYRNAIKLN